MTSNSILLGVPIHRSSMSGAVTSVQEFLLLPNHTHVVTLNNEMLVAAVHDSKFHQLLQHTINLPDSTGVALFSRSVRVPGADLTHRLLVTLSSQHPVFFLGAASGVAEKAAERMKSENPNLNIVGTYAGSPAPEEADAIINRINASGAQLLLVAYGAPQQDLWIAEHLGQLNTVRVAIGVGGTFDFLARTIQRAPQWLRSIGLEWLWRLILQPWRIKRIWNAVVVFPWLVLTKRK